MFVSQCSAICFRNTLFFKILHERIGTFNRGGYYRSPMIWTVITSGGFCPTRERNAGTTGYQARQQGTYYLLGLPKTGSAAEGYSSKTQMQSSRHQAVVHLNDMIMVFSFMMFGAKENKFQKKFLFSCYPFAVCHINSAK